ncbi:TPA: NUDIX hydrolase [Legionella pneumophila]|nr:NUDIX hydrolase [Legionella pneumophila]
MPRPKYINGRLQVATAFIHFTDPDGNVHVMLGRRQHGQRYGNYTFPGGNVDDTGESPEEAALREVQEETKLDLTSKKNPITGVPLQLRSEVIQYKQQGKSPAKDVHVVHVDLGQLSHEEIAKLKNQVQPQDDLAEVEFISQHDLAGKSLTRQNQRIINEYLSAHPSQAKVTSPTKPSLPDKHEAVPEVMQQKPWIKSSEDEAKKINEIHQSHANQKSTMQAFKSNPGHYKSAREQAEAIWKEQVEPSLKQGKSVGLIYAANNHQAEDLYAGYKTGKIKGVIGGSGQAPVYAEIAKMIEEKKLQNRVHILPVSTSMSGGDNMRSGNQVGLSHINRDLENIASHRAAGWEIRGISTPSGKYAIGGGESKGWHDAQKISISQQPDGTYQQQVVGNTNTSIKPGISQGEYVERRLQTMATEPVHQWPVNLQQASKIPPAQTHAAPIPAQSKWGHFKHEHEKISTDQVQSKSLFTAVIETNPLTLKEIERNLQYGKIPLKSEHLTHLDHFLQSGKEGANKNEAADLLAIYSVKSVMGDLATQVRIEMVDNNRADVQGHDKHAMKIQFKSQEEAQAFAEKLFKEHGVHSHTLGFGVMKTPQNGAIYLTPNDLEKISQNAKLASQSGTGLEAYATKAKSYEQEKTLGSEEAMDDEESQKFQMK